MTDFDAVKKRATLPTRTVPLCLDAELVDKIAQLEAQLADAKPPTSLGDASPRRVIAEQIAELQDRMRESKVDFKLRALPSRTWDKFWAAAPTRKDGETDDEWEGRAFPFYAEMLSRSCTDPVMSVEQVTELVDLIHHKAWSTLVSECMALNMREVDIPNSDAASELIRDSEQT